MAFAKSTKVTRYNRLGIAQGTPNRADWYTDDITFTPTIVALTTAITVAVPFPGPGFLLTAAVNVLIPESTAAVPTLSVGFLGGTGTEILDTVSVAAAGIFIDAAPQLVTYVKAAELTYTLSSIDFAELDCEVIVKVVGTTST